MWVSRRPRTRGTDARRRQSNAADWKKYVNWDPYKYTRNLVDDGNGKFNLIVLCWGEGQARLVEGASARPPCPGASPHAADTPWWWGSAIHDHAGSHCLMKILDGTVQETRYAWPEMDASGAPRPLRQTQTTLFHRDEVAYVHGTSDGRTPRRSRLMWAGPTQTRLACIVWRM